MKKNKKTKEVVVYKEYSDDPAIQTLSEVLEDFRAGRTHYKNANAVANLVKAMAMKQAVNTKTQEALAKLEHKKEIEV